MRIMIVTDQYPPMPGGVPTVTQDLAREFAKRGHEVWVAAPSYGPYDVMNIDQNVRVYRFSSIEWPAWKGVRIPLLPYKAMRELLIQSNPDIVHIHMPMVLGQIAQTVARSLGKPVVLTNHSLPMNISYSLMKDPLVGKQFSSIAYSYLVNFSNRCEHVTAPTMTALTLLHQHGLRAPASAISNGIDLKTFKPGEADRETMHHFKLPEDRPLLIHVNRLAKEKRVDVLLDAMAQIDRPVHLALLGTGPEEIELREQVEHLQISDRVSFLGFVRGEKLLALLRSARLFVIPSEADTQSLATMEAMACGLPIVAADAYALPELVDHGNNGLLFQPGESRELAGALSYLLENEAECKRMGQESLHIIGRHDRKLVLDEWEKLYLSLSSKQQRASKSNLERRLPRPAALT